MVKEEYEGKGRGRGKRGRGNLRTRPSEDAKDDPKDQRSRSQRREIPARTFSESGGMPIRRTSRTPRRSIRIQRQETGTTASDLEEFITTESDDTSGSKGTQSKSLNASMENPAVARPTPLASHHVSQPDVPAPKTALDSKTNDSPPHLENVPIVSRLEEEGPLPIIGKTIAAGPLSHDKTFEEDGPLSTDMANASRGPLPPGMTTADNAVKGPLPINGKTLTALPDEDKIEPSSISSVDAFYHYGYTDDQETSQPRRRIDATVLRIKLYKILKTAIRLGHICPEREQWGDDVEDLILHICDVDNDFKMFYKSASDTDVKIIKKHAQYIYDIAIGVDSEDADAEARNELQQLMLRDGIKNAYSQRGPAKYSKHKPADANSAEAINDGRANVDPMSDDVRSHAFKSKDTSIIGRDSMGLDGTPIDDWANGNVPDHDIDSNPSVGENQWLTSKLGAHSDAPTPVRISHVDARKGVDSDSRGSPLLTTNLSTKPEVGTQNHKDPKVSINRTG